MNAIAAKTKAALLGATLVFGLPGAAQAFVSCTLPIEAELAERDATRITDLEQSRTRGLAAALVSTSAEDRAAVSALFEGGTTFVSAELEGNYQCRTIKMGGISDLIIYSWFQCRISEKDGLFFIEKTTGSQNFSGYLYPSDAGGFVYRGAYHYGYEKPMAYDDDPERNESGCVSSVVGDSRHFILELPFPALESLHDVIELVPAN